MACCGGDLMPFRCPSTATHGVQYSATARPSKHGDDAGLARRRREIQALELRVSVRAAEKHDVREPREAQVVDEGAAPLQQPLRIRSRNALADVAFVDLGTGGVQRQLGARVHRLPPRFCNAASTASTIA